MGLQDILFVGDVHGSLKDIDHAFILAAKNNINTIVQVGDFWAYSDHEIKKMKRIQDRVHSHFGIKVQLHFIDGNHEDFRIINPHVEDTVEMFPDLLYYHPRGDVFTVNGVVIGCFGGAASIDKTLRTPGKTWFDDEIPTMSDVHRATENFKNASIDVLITHDVPAYAIKQVRKNDEEKIKSDESIKIRSIIEQLSIHSQAPLIIHGHWHHFAHNKYDITLNKFGDELNVNVISLNMNSHPGALITTNNNGNTVNIIQ